MSIQNNEEQKNNYKEIILWQNGKNKSYSFKYKIPLYSSTIKIPLSQFKKEIIMYIKSNKNNNSSINEIIHHNHLKDVELSRINIIHLYTIKEIDLEESDIPYLKTNDILFFSFDNSSFQDSNHYHQYEFIQWIKSGGYGQVFLAKKIYTEKEYAIKQIDTNNFSTEEVYNISRENLILRTMNHKNVIKLYDSFMYDKKFFTVMDYARGGELTVLLEGKDGNKNNKLSENECKKIFKQIYDAVCYIHERNIIHRDLKPNNILFLDEEKTHVVIIDFGISGFSNGNNREKIKAGTTMFLAPETACGKEYCSNRKLDIWAMGIILYRMVEGVYPFDGKNSKEIINNILKKNLEFNKKIKMSKPMKDLICGLLEKNHRFRIDDDSELFSKWFEYMPTRKNSTIEIIKISKDPIFDNSNKDSDNKLNNNVNMNTNEENNKENNKESNKENKNSQISSYSNVVRGISHKDNNKFKILFKINKEKKYINFKQSAIDYNNNDINKKINNINTQRTNIKSNHNNKELENNFNKNKQLILPALNNKNERKNYEVKTPLKTKSAFKIQKNMIKSNFPIFGNNLFNNKFDSLENNINSDIKKETLLNYKYENQNNNNIENLSNYSCKKRSTSEFRKKILKTINNNNLFNKNSLNNNNNNYIPSSFKNSNDKSITTFNESPTTKNKFKSMGKKNRNISSYEIVDLPLIDN